MMTIFAVHSQALAF